MKPDVVAKICRQTASAESFRYTVERRHLTQAAEAIEGLLKEVETLTAELERRKEIIRYWSYCTDRGMLRECPEKVNELADALMSVGVAPYSIRR